MSKLNHLYIPTLLVNLLFLLAPLHTHGQRYDPVESDGIVSFGLFIPEQVDDVAMTRLQVKTAIEYSVEKMNLSLSQKGAGFTVSVYPVNQLDATVDSLNELNKRKVQLVSGPESSRNLYATMEQARSNNQLLFSYGSTSPIEAFNRNENVFRMLPNGLSFVTHIVQRLKDTGVTHVSSLYINDAFGQGLNSELEKQCESANLSLISTSYTRQTKPAPGFYSKLVQGKFRDKLLSQTSTVGAEKTAVVIFGFEETGYLMAAAHNDDDLGILHSVQWYGVEPIPEILKNEDARFFANQVHYTIIWVAPENPNNTELNEVRSQLLSVLSEGVEPVMVAYSAYETIQLLGKAVELAIEKFNKSDTDSIKITLPEVAATYEGLLGPATFNAYGQRASGYFQFQQVQGDKYQPLKKEPAFPPFKQTLNHSSTHNQEKRLR